MTAFIMGVYERFSISLIESFILTFMRSVKTVGPFLPPSDKNVDFQQLDKCGCTIKTICCQKQKKN